MLRRELGFWACEDWQVLGLLGNLGQRAAPG